MKKLLITLLNQIGVGFGAFIELNAPQEFVSRFRCRVFDTIGYNVDFVSVEGNHLICRVSKGTETLLFHYDVVNNHVQTLDIEEV